MKPPKTHALRPGEPVSLCGAVAWRVAIVPPAIEPSCGTCRRIRDFQKAHEVAGKRVPRRHRP